MVFWKAISKTKRRRMTSKKAEILADTFDFKRLYKKDRYYEKTTKYYSQYTTYMFKDTEISRHLYNKKYREQSSLATFGCVGKCESDTESDVESDVKFKSTVGRIAPKAQRIDHCVEITHDEYEEQKGREEFEDNYSEEEDDKEISFEEFQDRNKDDIDYDNYNRIAEYYNNETTLLRTEYDYMVDEEELILKKDKNELNQDVEDINVTNDFKEEIKLLGKIIEQALLLKNKEIYLYENIYIFKAGEDDIDLWNIDPKPYYDYEHEDHDLYIEKEYEIIDITIKFFDSSEIYLQITMCKD